MRIILKAKRFTFSPSNQGTEHSSEGNKQEKYEENEENLPPAKLEVKKKPKKTVQLTEVVMVHETDGQVCDTKGIAKHLRVVH